MDFLSLCVCFLCLSFSVAIQATSLCQPSTVVYHIGEQVTLLDIAAAEVSVLWESCRKDVHLPGAIETRLFVPSADFGYNTRFSYVDQGGQIGTPLYDKINIYFTPCGNISKQHKLALQTNVTEIFKEQNLCLEILPELQLRYMGNHINGGKIVVYVEVMRAECQRGDAAFMGCERNCEQTSSGSVCDKPTVYPPVVSNTTHVVPTHVNSQSWRPTVTTETSMPIPRSTTEITRETSTSVTMSTAESTSQLSTSRTVPTSTASAVNLLNQSTPITTALTPKTTETATVTTKRTQRSTVSTMNIPTTLLSTSIHSTTTISPENDRFTTVISFVTSSTVADVTTHNRTDSAAAIDHSIDSEQELFGLLEGLYVVGAGIVVLLALTLTVCIVRRHRQRCVHIPLSGTISDTSDAGALAWRDNWLVRYQGNKSDSDVDAEKDFHYIHGKFHHCSNSELHHIHLDPYTEGYEFDEENAYDKPWPLIRLDSDFIEKTKSIEREMSSTGISEALQLNSKETLNGSENETLHENNNICTKNSIDANRKKTTEVDGQKTSTPKYSVVRVQRSSSKSSRCSTMPRHKSLTQSNSQTSGRETMTVDRKIRRTRPRNSSSISSQCSANIEDFMKKEISNIEAVFEQENIKATFDLESRNPVESANKSKGWKISAIYAIVNKANDDKFNRNSRSSARRSASKRSNGSPVRGLSYHAIADQKAADMSAKPHHDVSKDQTHKPLPDTKNASSPSMKPAKLQNQETTESANEELPGQLEVAHVWSRESHVPSGMLSASPITQPFRVSRDYASGTVQFRK